MKEAREQWHEGLRAVAMKRAAEKSDVLLIFLLKSLKPDLYDDELRKTKYLIEQGGGGFLAPTIVFTVEPPPGPVANEPEPVIQ